MVVAGAISRADVAALCDQLGRRLDRCGGEVVCDVGALLRADVSAVDGLARLQLTAHRHGGRIVVQRPSAELRRLIELCGLDAVLPADDASAGTV